MSEPRTFEEFFKAVYVRVGLVSSKDELREAWDASRAALLADRPDVAAIIGMLEGYIANALPGIDTEIMRRSRATLESLAAQLAALKADYDIMARRADNEERASERAEKAEEEVKRLREIMRELLDSEATPCPPFESGKESQDAWADRRAKARNDAEAATKEPTR